jgi:hypothetical protein
VAKQKNVRVVIPSGVASYAYLSKPDEKFPKNGKPVYKVSVIVDAGDERLEALEKACLEVASEKFPKVKPADFRMPFGPDEKEREEFEGKILIKTSTVFKPKLVDAKKNLLPASVMIFSGDVIKCVADLFPYESTERVKENGKTRNITTRGVSLQLVAVQLLDKRAGGGAEGGLDMLDEEDGFVAEHEDEDEAGYDRDNPPPSDNERDF